MGSNTDDMIIIPSTTAISLAGTRNVQTVYIKSSDEKSVDLVTNEVNSYLTSFFKSTDNNNRVMSQKQLLDTMSLISSTMTYLLGGIAAISLIVGGIGWAVSALGMSMTFSIPIVIVAFSFSLAVGVIFGIFPAYKASNLKPIDALRFE